MLLGVGMCIKGDLKGLPQWLSGEELACKAGVAGDTGSIPGLGRSPGGGHGNPLQYSHLENPCGLWSLEDFSPWGCKELDMTEQLNIPVEKIWV